MWEIHCCINRMYTEPLETILRIIPHLDGDESLDDKQFFKALRKAIRQVSGNHVIGLLRRTFSWKRCSRIIFIEVKSLFPVTSYCTD